jgi:cytochrome c oxidase assembly factor 1
MQGRVDLKFRIHGDKQAGTLYFTSIRPKQEGAWRIGELECLFSMIGS